MKYEIHIGNKITNGIFDRISRVVSLTAASAPDFWVAITAILIFSVLMFLL